MLAAIESPDPAECRYPLDLASLKQAHVRFAVARDSSGAPVGCGAIVLGADYGELKRMYVAEPNRGQGVAVTILQLLEAEACKAGCTVFTLETGPYQPEAIKFYTSHGYLRRGPYGDYPDDPLSVFMQKDVGAVR